MLSPTAPWRDTESPCVRDVNTIDLKFGNCQLERIPVKIKESKGDWWLWWVPHPHIGGRPYTRFTMSIQVDGNECKLRQ